MRRGFFTSLPNRGTVRIAGPDRRLFLQGLITNDVALLDPPGAMVYACLLTPQGKFLHDFFMTEQDDMIQLECEGSARAADLAATLKKFRLRSKVEIEHTETQDVFVSLNGQYRDPRHPALGARSYTRPDEGDEAPFAEWDRHRITFGIPDGSRDMLIGQSTMMECGLDRLNALSLTKGCYMGQELTARMHYRGLAKRHLIPVHIPGHPPGSTLPPPGTDLRDGDTLIGEMRSSCGNIGLALLRDDALERLNTAGLMLLVK